MKKFISIGLVAIIAFEGFWPGLVFCKSRDVVAVLDFHNTTEQETYNYLSRTISEAVATNLGKLKGVELVERGLLVKVFEEMKFALSDFVDPNTAVEVGHAVGATAVVVGSFSVMGRDLRINARVVEVSTGKVLESESAEGKMHKVSDVANRLSEDLWMALTGKKITRPFYKRWWFWTLVVVAGGTAAAYQQK
ncbi:MAG: hypothetical protein J7M27_11500, partial [Candidatus Latescibacteria bacterium]|nr:hypothetical protein [Candidatus Latescibacterota bacterium]